jgi:ADP-heptose:LPS heptosyltransferase
MAKYLVVRFSSIGDIVLTTPVLRCIKQQLPEVTLHYLTKSIYWPLLEANPYVDSVHVLGDSWRSNIEELKSEQYDAVIDLHHNLRTWRLWFDLKVPVYRFPKLNWRKWLVVQTKRKALLPHISVVDRYFEAVKVFGVRPDGEGVEYWIPSDAGFPVEHLPAYVQQGYIAWAIGGAHATKRLPVDRLLQLAALLPYPMVIVGGPEDAPVGQLLAAHYPQKIYNLSGQCTLHQSADIIRQSRLVLSHDTGMMHIGAAFHKPMVTIWGNTIPEFGMFPYYGSRYQQGKHSPLFDVIEHDVSCRPCSKIGYDACPRGHFKCMRALDLLEIARAVHRRWKQASEMK